MISDWILFPSHPTSLPALAPDLKSTSKPAIQALLRTSWFAIQDPSKERIKLLNRKGFVRVAVETGTSIIPVYHFGGTQVNMH